MQLRRQCDVFSIQYPWYALLFPTHSHADPTITSTSCCWYGDTDFSGHGGGDTRLVHEFIEYLRGEISMSKTLTAIDRSVESHLVALAAEASRKNGGHAIEL